MDKLDHYRNIIRAVIDEYSVRYRPQRDEIVNFTIIDADHDHYQLVRDGWVNHRRFYGPVLHFQILDGKVWIRHDGTEFGITDELIERGIDKRDLVLAFHSPAMRDLVKV